MENETKDEMKGKEPVEDVPIADNPPDDGSVSKERMGPAVDSESLRTAKNLVKVTDYEIEQEKHLIEEEREKKTQQQQPNSSLHKGSQRTRSDERPCVSQNSAKKPGSLIGAIFRRSTSQGKSSIHTIPSSPAGFQVKVNPEEGGAPIEEPDTTWADVFRACCCHSAAGWLRISWFLFSLMLCLYFFLVALDLLGTAFKVVGGCTAGSLLSSDTNPLASVLIGLIATALLQSSSTTTSIIVSLVSGGLDVQQGIYMVMGANIGTCVTAMLVSLAHMGEGDELERAFAGSSLLYIFNFFTVCILLPLEITTHYLYYLTKAMLPATVGDGDSWEGPVKKIVNPLVKRIIIANKQLIDDISTGKVESCSAPGVYPVMCVDGIESYESCQEVGVISCDKKSGECPLFFQNGATREDDMVSGWVCMVVAVTVLTLCLIVLVALLRKMLLGASTQVVYKATSINPYLAILIGCGVTILVQSSSITSSALVPLAGVGVLDLKAMYPIVLGADIGTTFTALMAAMVSSNVQGLQIALCHMFFNITGVLIWYPIPFLRNIVLRLATLTGKATRHWRGFPIVFIVFMFFVLPVLLLGISSCFEQGSIGFTALGSFILLLIFAAITYFLLWWFFRDGKARCASCVQRRQRRAAAIRALADDMDYLKVDTEYLKNEVGRIKDFASHLNASVRMEEGRPIVTLHTLGGEDETMATNEEDERLSTFESCRSKPWKDILFSGAGSIRSGLHGSIQL